MAKTRAQRKAERRKRQAQLERQGLSPEEAQRAAAERDEESRAQQDTQVPRSGEEAEFEAVLETGARTEDYGEKVEGGGGADGPEASAVATPKPEAPEAPAPSKADVGRPDGTEVKEPKESRRERRRREKEGRRKARAREQRQAEEKAEKRRGPVTGFIASCWAELKRVQWPDRDTLVQASAVTIIFVAIMAAYLGALDAAFNWLVQRLI